jgi:glycosyltransferase involved in cell wall biosynthesis
MPEIDNRSIRVVVDLQACQTAGSAHRGVGRYSRSLFLEMFRQSGRREFFGLAAPHLPFSVAWPEFPEKCMIRPPLLPDWGGVRSFEGGNQDALDAALYACVTASALPDIVHVSHLFEGYGDRVAIPFIKNRPAGQILSATLYDLIPMRFSDHYFRDKRFKAWYMQRVQLLRQADLLLAISESSRQDSIDLLGLDPSRVVTIYGGISDHFRPAKNVSETRARLMARYHISRPRFILYTGGDDHRKNLQGAIDGYAALPHEIRRDTQLVIVCALEPHRKVELNDAAKRAGLTEGDILFLGYLPEDDLVGLYSTCDLFVFPSLYEGLGLPVLEAMACGAPVIGGNNSSIKELIYRPDALFDSGSPASTAEAMHRVLSVPGLADDLRAYGVKRVTKFNWPSTAAQAIEAFDEAVARKRQSGVSAAAAGWLKRGRLAVLTPLPPDRSGIADYNAQFLPFLAEHFELDVYVVGNEVSDAELNAAFRIFDAADFAANAKAYDAILYEFGNSEFHAHMLELLRQFPGVVGLHDAYLSGLFAYLDFHVGETNRYAYEMLEAHGAVARREFAPISGNPDPVGTTVVNLPCTKSVLNQAIGVISHSPFNLEIARQFYPEGCRAPYRTIPQMVTVPEVWSPERRQTARAKFGFGPDDFVVATFGHIAWTKCGDRLLDAILNSELAADRTCHLVYVGELAKDHFGYDLGDRIKNSKLGQRIRVTGFVSDEDYSTYMRTVDLAVQLRTKSRGGTPKGVLDCLAYGVPVIVNDEASYQDYPDDVVIKLGADPDAAEIAQGLLMLRQSPERRRGFTAAAQQYVRAQHDPRTCAQQYAAAITEFVSRHAANGAATLARELAPYLAACPSPDHAAAAAAAFVASFQAPSFLRPRLLIDVSHIANNDHGTGIPRVVRETVRAAYLRGRAEFDVVAFQRVNDQIQAANRWLEQQQLALSFEAAPASQKLIDVHPGDYLLMLDSSWAEFDHFAPIFAKARAAHVPITTVVYDLLPVTLPEADVVDGGKVWFEGWVRNAIAASDNLLCISRTMADELIAYVEKHELGKPGLQIGYWHLGSAITAPVDVAQAGPDFGITGPYALMIGTIEPRKNHALALAAFERLWQKGVNLSLVIAGRKGWLVDGLMAKLHNHPALGKTLFLFEEIDDARLSELYRKAHVVLFVSKGEGFGLPLVEAANYGAPIICSDIPVFREIAENHATFVGIADPNELAADIETWMAASSAGTAPPSTGLPRVSWTQSTEMLLDVVIGHRWYWKKS